MGKGKEGYPTIGFQCITDYNRQIPAIYGPQFGTRNDKEIVKIDTNVKKIRFGWISNVWWRCYAEDGSLRSHEGAYLVCDNGYLRWPESICPYSAGEPSHTLYGHFSANLESVRKDVKCTFGIMKKRWKILNDGLRYRYIKIFEKFSSSVLSSTTT